MAYSSGMAKKRGPKTESGLDDLKRRTVIVDDATWRMLGVVGGGNTSKGVRKAARQAYQIYQRTPDDHPK